MDLKDYFDAHRKACRLPKWDELPDIELYMDQVITLMNKYIGGMSLSNEPVLTSSMINNYVKNDIIPPPVKKKYSRTHLFRLIIICIMKPVLPINDISTLIDTMLKNGSEQEVLDFFSEQYESIYIDIMDVLENCTEKNSSETKNETLLAASIMRAAAISSGSMAFAESALEELHRVTSENNTLANVKN